MQEVSPEEVGVCTMKQDNFEERFFYYWGFIGFGLFCSLAYLNLTYIALMVLAVAFMSHVTWNYVVEVGRSV